MMRMPARDRAADACNDVVSENARVPGSALRKRTTRCASRANLGSREVRQASVPGVAGTLTAQFRNIAEVTTAVSNGDFSRFAYRAFLDEKVLFVRRHRWAERRRSGRVR